MIRQTWSTIVNTARQKERSERPRAQRTGNNPHWCRPMQWRSPQTRPWPGTRLSPCPPRGVRGTNAGLERRVQIAWNTRDWAERSPARVRPPTRRGWSTHSVGTHTSNWCHLTPFMQREYATRLSRQGRYGTFITVVGVARCVSNRAAQASWESVRTAERTS